MALYLAWACHCEGPSRNVLCHAIKILEGLVLCDECYICHGNLFLFLETGIMLTMAGTMVAVLNEVIVPFFPVRSVQFSSLVYCVHLSHTYYCDYTL